MPGCNVKRRFLEKLHFLRFERKRLKESFFQDKTANKLLFLIEVCVQRYQAGGKAVRHEK